MYKYISDFLNEIFNYLKEVHQYHLILLHLHKFNEIQIINASLKLFNIVFVLFYIIGVYNIQRIHCFTRLVMNHNVN